MIRRAAAMELLLHRQRYIDLRLEKDHRLVGVAGRRCWLVAFSLSKQLDI